MNKSQHVKSVKTINQHRIRMILITLQTIYLVFLLFAQWTSPGKEIRTFFDLFEMTEWETIVTFIPFVIILQATALNSRMFYISGLIWFTLVFILEFTTFLILLYKGSPGEFQSVDTCLNVMIKIVEFVNLFMIITIILKSKTKREQ